MIAKHIIFRGRVQGVGFRYTVRSIGARFAVTGFVKNLPDGRVQLVAEGTAAELGAFVAAVDAEMGYYIQDTQRRTAPATGRFAGFDVRF